MVKIDGITKGSYAELLEIKSGETLAAINGHDIKDVLDYRFYETESNLELLIMSSDGRERRLKLKKPQYESIGLEFSTYLMDKESSCRNKCIFCFIDQLPKGMRDTLYFKDDDDRLSFLFGNYVTLTNMNEEEIDRIISMHISPINISVHTMNPELRCKMMNNRFAGESLNFIKKLSANGIRLNCQLVLCPGYNDGEELKFSLEELKKLGPNLQSIACVPVGVTRYREGLEQLTPYNEESAGETIDIIEAFGESFLRENGARTVFASDEFYIIAGRELPPYEFYEDFPQIENGVGMIRNLEEEFRWALDDCEPSSFEVKRHISLVTGEAVYPFITSLLDELKIKCNNLNIDVYPIKNEFFGGTVNVTGLITGSDIIRELKGKDLGDELLIPSSMLKADEDIFLDDITMEKLSEELGVKLRKVGALGEDLLNAALDI